jgi:hypothetical protein
MLCASAATLLLLAHPTAAEQPAGGSLSGDYFVGASVFLFERTVLAAFAPAGTTDSMLDAGAIVLAGENAGDEDSGVALDAISGWLEATAIGRSDPVPGLGRERAQGLVCLLYGLDAAANADLAGRAKINPGSQPDCAARYSDARHKWLSWLLPFRKSPSVPAPISAAPEGAPAEGEPVLQLSFAPTFDDANQAIADAMQKNGLFQLLTDDFNAALAMPRPITALITQCGEPKAFYNADRGEAVLCYELLAELVKNAPK